MAKLDNSKVLVRIGSTTWTIGTAKSYLAARPDASEAFKAAVARGASPAAAFEYVVNLGEETVAEAKPESAKPAKAPKPKKAGPILEPDAPEPKTTGGKESLTTREANTDFGMKLTAKAFKVAKETAGPEVWTKLTAKQKLDLVLSVPQVSELKGSAATGAIRALATRIGTTRGGEELVDDIVAWGTKRGVVKPAEEFGVTVRGVKEITNKKDLSKEERNALRGKTRDIAKRRGKGVKGGDSETRVSATEKATARTAVASPGDELAKLIEQLKADQAETIKNTQTSSDEGAKVFLMDTGEINEETGEPKKARVRIDSKGGALEPGRARKGQSDPLSALGAKQNAEYEIASTRAAWRAYNDALPKGEPRISAKEYIAIEMDGLSKADQAKLARAISKLRQQERVTRLSGKGVKPAKPKVTKLISQTPEAGRAKANAKEEIRVRRQNTPSLDDIFDSEPVAPKEAVRAVTKAVVSGKAVPEGVAKPAKRAKRVGTVTRKPTFQDSVLSQLSETGGKKDVKDFLALKALRGAGFDKKDVRARATQMGVSANVRKAAKASGLLSFAAMALQHLDGEKKRKKKD
jgi:hypothetical protein